jgi:glycosyltransferase 2 family protein
MRQLLFLVVKAAVSVLLLYLALRSVDLSVVGQRLSRLDLSWFIFILFVLLLLLAQITLIALRWRQIVLVTGASIPFEAALRYSLIAAFFNQTLPSTVGGDAARVWLLGRSGAGWKLATYSVLIDRGVGLFMLAVLVMACFPWTLALVSDPLGRTVLLSFGLGTFAGAFVFVSIASAPKRWMQKLWALRHLAAVAEITWRLCRSRRVGLVAMLSLAIHLLTVTAVWLVAKSVAVPLDFWLAVFLIPPVLLIASLPVSIAGWGLREGVMIAGFAYAGLAESDGLIVSLLFGAASFLVGALGGMIWILRGGRLHSPLQSAMGTYERR